MIIPTGKIQLFVTEDEANVILQALGRYIFHGPYWPVECYDKLTDGEKDRANKMKDSARDMCESLQEELLCRYQEAEQIKFYEGR